MNFTRIKYFLTAAKYLNFTKASDVLYISQPSLSKQIAVLEDELGVSLFDRSKRDLKLTPAGNLLFSEFNRIMPEAESVIDKVKRMNGNVKTLFIGSVESISLCDASVKAVNDFVSQVSDAELFIERCSFEVLHSKVLDGSIDIAFTLSTQIGKMKGIKCAELEKRRRYIIMSANHRLAVKDDIAFNDLRNETFVLYDSVKSMVSYDDIFDACREAGFFPNVRYAPNNNTILDYLELGGCIAFLDKSITENRKGRLKYYPTGLSTQFSLVCIWRNDNTNPVLQEFISFLPKSVTQ